MNQRDTKPKEAVMAYIEALDGGRYEEAMSMLHDNVRIWGPAGETFGRPIDFIEMLRRHHGRYDIKKVFVEGEDVCVLYDLTTTSTSVYMSSWYTVKDGRITSIRTVFDPTAFGPPPSRKP